MSDGERIVGLAISFVIGFAIAQIVIYLLAHLCWCAGG
jgi:hypothetical protein